MRDMLLRSEWLRATIFSMAATTAFLIFYSALPSALIDWSDTLGIVENYSTGTALGPRIRDVFIVGYYATITPLTFVAFALYQRMFPVNADPDEPKRESGGYR